MFIELYFEFMPQKCVFCTWKSRRNVGVVLEVENFFCFFIKTYKPFVNKNASHDPLYYSIYNEQSNKMLTCHCFIKRRAKSVHGAPLRALTSSNTFQRFLHPPLSFHFINSLTVSTKQHMEINNVSSPPPHTLLVSTPTLRQKPT